jgi:antitoxin ChpS
MPAGPPAPLEHLQIQTGATVGLGLDQGPLVVESLPKPCYALTELLANSDYSQAASQEDREWLSSAAVSNKLL